MGNPAGGSAPGIRGSQAVRSALTTNLRPLSPNTWVASAYCDSPSCAALFRFNPNASNTFHPSNQSLNIFYRFGWMKAVIGYDTIRVSWKQGTESGQTFGLSKVYNRHVESQPVDGILGLGYSKLAGKGSTSIVDNLKKQRVVSEPVFAFYLSTQKENGSMVMFGGVDHSYHKGELNWIPVSQAGFWQIAMDRISMNGTVIGCSCGCQALVDTGTAMLFGPSNAVAKIRSFIHPRLSGKPEVKGHATGKSSPVIFTINGIDYPVPPQAYIQKINESLCFSSFEGGTEGFKGPETWVLGDIFLRLYFSVFDWKNNKVGLAPAV
uniref:Peptidase A1 domain-containing protein n=1 Tax=Moschus moschiferus TaxID=68415 RepID=A0A8C6DK54_MOSMO